MSAVATKVLQHDESTAQQATASCAEPLAEPGTSFTDKLAQRLRALAMAAGRANWVFDQTIDAARGRYER